MSVSYTKEQKQAAKDRNEPLVTIDTGGMKYQGPCPEEMRRELVEFYLGFTKRLAERTEE